MNRNAQRYVSGMRRLNRVVNFRSDSVTVSENFFIANNGIVYTVNTGGDVQRTTTVTIGGVSATSEDLSRIHNILDNLANAIMVQPKSDDQKEEALEDLNTLAKQLTSEKRANPKLLTRAAKTLYRFSPLIAGGIVTLFGDPIIGKIVLEAGDVAVNFVEQLMKHARPPAHI